MCVLVQGENEKEFQDRVTGTMELPQETLQPEARRDSKIRCQQNKKTDTFKDYKVIVINNAGFCKDTHRKDYHPRGGK